MSLRHCVHSPATGRGGGHHTGSVAMTGTPHIAGSSPSSSVFRAAAA
ncbi:hypothetical protein [Blastococcus sp. SYSU DS0973]